MIDEIRECSYQLPPYYDTLNFGDLLAVLLTLAPEDYMTWFFSNLDRILDRGNLPDAVSAIFSSLMVKIR